ncbi:MAG: hypothetical protein ACRDL5_10005 [Solirubrobacteraceae bacterium]
MAAAEGIAAAGRRRRAGGNDHGDRDVTEQKRAEQRGAFLAKAGAVLASSLDYQQTLRNVAALAVPEIVDWCAVDLLDPEGDRVSVAVAHVDPARLELAEDMRAYEPGRLDPSQGLGLVLTTGEAALYPEITDEMLVRGAVDERHLELLRAVGSGRRRACRCESASVRWGR